MSNERTTVEEISEYIENVSNDARAIHEEALDLLATINDMTHQLVDIRKDIQDALLTLKEAIEHEADKENDDYENVIDAENTYEYRSAMESFEEVYDMLQRIYQR